MSCVKRVIATCFRALTAVLIAAVLAGPAYAASDSVSVSLPVSQRFVNYTTLQAEDTFSYVLTPLESETPMPEQGADRYSFTLKGTEDVKLAQIVFNRTGIYRYELKQTAKNRKEGYTCDEEVYTLKIYVTNAADGGLTASTVAYTESGEKVDHISFANSYRKEDASTAPGHAPQTGDPVNLTLWLMLLALSAICFAGALAGRQDDDIL